jgi:hypothetical protein
MSKISEYLAALRLKEAELEAQTVGQFASKLRKSSAVLLEQLKKAGLSKQHASDILTDRDKEKFLTQLQKSHRSKGPRKKIEVTIDSEGKKIIRRVSAKENGAEFSALEYMLGMVLGGHKIDPDLQQLINLIVAKAIIFGALPLQTRGRPKRKELDSIGRAAAEKYWEMVDSGSSYELAVETVSAKFHKSERHVMRLIAPHKKSIGESLEQRITNRIFWEMRGKLHTENSFFEQYQTLFGPKIPSPDFTNDDYRDHLDEMIQQLAANSKPLTKKN